MQILSVLQQADLRLFAWLFRSGEKYLLVLPARSLSRSGDGYLHLCIPLLLAAMGVADVGNLVLLMLLALAMERPLYWVLKNSLRRRRPQDALQGFRSLIIASDQFSFPSGHSSGAFLLATCLCLVYGSVGLGVFLWATGVALSRVLLGVHFPGDLLAGAAMGSGLALLAGHLLGL